MMKYELEDMVKDKIWQIEFALNSIGCFEREKVDESLDPPPLWEDSGFKTWKEFRAKRNKEHVTRKDHPRDYFPMAGFNMSEPGAITIIKDDFTDLLQMLRRKNFSGMHHEYVGSVFFAIDISDARHHYMLGSFCMLDNIEKRMREAERSRKERSKNVQQNEHNSKKDLVLESFKKLFRKFNSSELPRFHRIAIKIMEDNKEPDTYVKVKGEFIKKGTEKYRMKITTVKTILKELYNEGKISLPIRQ